MQLSFRLDKRPGESHLALDGKKVHGKSLFVVVFVGPCPFRFLLCFSAGWRNANLAGRSACRLFFGCFCVLFWVFDLPCYMTTGVNVEFISNCFFTCKDRALERDRPYQRKKILKTCYRQTRRGVSRQYSTSTRQ